MPIVRVRKNSNFNKIIELSNLAIGLKHSVAKGLNVPGCRAGLLSASDVEVYFDNIQPMDRCSKNIEIIIEANFVFERLVNLEERAKLITEEAKRWIPSNYTFFVWVRLAHGAYMEG